MISNEELNALMQAINSRYGLDFTHYERNSLKRGIIRLMMKHKMKTIIELWYVILQEDTFFMEAIDDLLVNLTSLFRNPDVWIKLEHEVLQKIDSPRLKIWHAGCSTGEEVYTMTFLLEAQKRLQTAEIIATDLSKVALTKAIKGQYALNLLEQYMIPLLKFFPEREMSDYFQYQDAFATIKPKYQERVTFKNHNLVTDPGIDQFDIVFCRNVMIYFDDLLKKKVLDLLHQSLKPNGYLVIGYYDIMPEHGKNYFDIYDLKTRIYQKKA